MSEGEANTTTERAAAALAAALVLFPRAAVAVLIALTGLSAVAVIDFFVRGVRLVLGQLRTREAAEPA